MSESPTTGSESQKSPPIFEGQQAPASEQVAQRHFEVFDDVEAPLQAPLPESVSGQSSAPASLESSASSQSLSWRSKFLVSVVAIVLGAMVWVELARVYYYFSALHSGLGVLWLALVFGLGVAGAGLWWRSVRQLDGLSQAAIFREEAESHLVGNNFGNTAPFQKALQRFYKNTPQWPHLSAAVQTLPAAANDNEVIKHLERCFVAKLDAQVIEKINHYAARNGLMIALSPWPLIDSLLCFSNCFRLAKEIALIYGLKPSYAARWQLIKRIAANIMVAAGTETVISTLMEDSSLASLKTLSVRAGQGVGVGLYTARIGCYAMAACRPLPFDQCAAPTTRDLVVSLLQKLKGKRQ